MRESKTLKKLRAGKTVRMCALGHFIPAFIRQAADKGFDCIWLDLEHRAMADREVQALLAYFHLCNIDCMVRAPTLEKTKLYRYLEDGAAGLLIPLVSTPEKARSLVQAVKFPPLGERGLDGAGLDSDFYLRGDADFPGRANRETFLVVQIETPEAVANVDAIVAVEGIDGVFIGPGDLGLRLKHAGSEAPTMEQAVARVAEAAARHGKAWGQPTFSLEHMQQLHAQGARILNHGGDFGAMIQMLQESSGRFDELCKDE
jgi:2-keto-3-deoxy-L-rhamnonate aldolase RhmA